MHSTGKMIFVFRIQKEKFPHFFSTHVVTMKVFAPLEVQLEVVLHLEVCQTLKRVQPANVSITDDLLVLAEEEDGLSPLPRATPFLDGAE